MTDTPKQKYESKMERLWGRADNYESGGMVENGEVSQRDAERIEELCTAFHPDKLSRTKHTEKIQNFDSSKQSDRSFSTLWGWCYNLSRVARDIDSVTTAEDLTDAEADDINDMMESGYFEGNAPNTSGMKKTTVRIYQDSLRVFFRYHDELNVDPSNIARFTGKSEPINPNDMLNQEEVSRLTAAADHPRDLMIFHLLLYTGLRSNAARTLRVGDINLDEGTYQLNPNADGNKGANKRNGDRPLLLAEGAIRQWLNQYHPEPENPDAYLITAKSPGKQTPSDTVGHNCLNYTLSKLKERAGVSKPLYPHALRHNFVTIAKSEWELPDDTVKFLIGHAKDSQVMETTYSHIKTERHVERAEVAAGTKDEPEHDDNTLTPIQCTCGADNPPGSVSCANCGINFRADAREAQETIEESIHVTKGQTAAAGDEKAEDATDLARDLLDDPEVKQAVMQEMKDELLDEMKDEL
jgi:integrase